MYVDRVDTPLPITTHHTPSYHADTFWRCGIFVRIRADRPHHHVDHCNGTVVGAVARVAHIAVACCHLEPTTQPPTMLSLPAHLPGSKLYKPLHGLPTPALPHCQRGRNKFADQGNDISTLNVVASGWPCVITRLTIRRAAMLEYTACVWSVYITCLACVSRKTYIHGLQPCLHIVCGCGTTPMQRCLYSRSARSVAMRPTQHICIN